MKCGGVMVKNNKKIYEYILIVLIGMLQAMYYILFVIRNDFAPAGINGVAVMVQYKLNFSIGYMSLLINVPLCVLAYFFVDKKFAFKTLIFCLVYSFLYLFLQTLDLTRFQYDADGVDTIYPVIIAGLLAGVVNGLSFRMNSSTGGTDIIGRYLSKIKPELNFFWVTFVLNAVVALASFFVYAKTGVDGKLVFDYKPVCLCILYCFVSGFVGNMMLKGSKSAYKFVIITSNSEQIEKDIIEKLHHSATRISAEGIYSSSDKQVLICVVNKHQLIDFQNIIKKYPDTFTIRETVNEIFGNFKKIK